jgi:hypothetical protein
VSALQKIAKVLAKQIPLEDPALGLTHREAERIRRICAEGMNLIRHDSTSVSDAVVRKAQKDQQRAQEERIKQREGWRDDRWRREGEEPRVGEI